jgi:hypothetical protein
LQDLNKLVENRVKDAIAQICIKRGIAKTEVYYGIGGHGMIGPLVAKNPATGEQAVIGFKPLWNLQLGLRSTLIGKEPIIGGLPIPSMFPTADEIEFVVDRLLGELQEMRDKQNTVPKLEVGRN